MNLMQRALPLLLATAIVAGAVAFAADEELDTGPAMAATQAWLAAVDTGRYGKSWDDASEFFRRSLAREKWEPMVASVRDPLGVVISRKVRSAVYARELTNAPPGPYVVIQFDTRFENRPLSQETVTTMRESDGSWKVSGYFVH